MSAMGNTVIEIQELLAEDLSVSEVAKTLNVPVSWVEDTASLEYEAACYYDLAPEKFNFVNDF